MQAGWPWRPGWAALLVAIGLVAAAPAAAQTEAPSAAAVDTATLRSFATAYARIGALRDQASEALGRTHEAQGRAAIREQLEGDIARVLEETGLTPDRYRRLVYLVSSDSAARAAFEKLLNDASGRSGGTSPDTTFSALPSPP